MLDHLLRAKTVFLSTLLVGFFSNTYAQENPTFYFGKEIGIDVAPLLFNAQGGSLLLKKVIKEPNGRKGKWAKQKNIKNVIGFYKLKPIVQSFMYVRGDSTIYSSSISNGNRITFQLGLEKVLRKKKIEFKFGGGLVYLNDKSNWSEIREIVEPGVFHAPSVRKYEKNTMLCGVSMSAGCSFSILSKIKIGADLHFTIAVSENFKSDRSLVFIPWPQLLYINYCLDNKMIIHTQN